MMNIDLLIKHKSAGLALAALFGALVAGINLAAAVLLESFIEPLKLLSFLIFIESGYAFFVVYKTAANAIYPPPPASHGIKIRCWPQRLVTCLIGLGVIGLGILSYALSLWAFGVFIALMAIIVWLWMDDWNFPPSY